ncbi:hypothetical protein CPAST_c25030 [Clostridium pasteurianum DSM 525 = ATCC 6013]|uniref:Cyclic lactone autoinducer peptide n=1 Tax=Clostridium pasteurianum DSM 525 = ATCC 6013 TaxID=1262449 RepID=A0A0H3J5U4_CLOPA|nr:hypothetical protein [Clostridium pasteurianum]AJA48572.1 hypothetical protein CPAST_c25030 [Clostridium pasteurianum DSM 525 = ATCC 6013]AJA52560.1 hypothetical protein CLPA_c25030 [Clostridium pasteurianum DSM 525 = ATCC 6013]KRU11430.1 hypothetical protein CP6013_00677 [Clostridium pasteurianum DSM 525 = ATCC 6013]
MINKKLHKSILNKAGFCLIAVASFITVSSSLFLLGEPTPPKSLYND